MLTLSDETGPLAGLPPADRTLLVRPPLALAILEVRFLADSNDVPPELGLRVRERLAELGHPYARLERAQEGRVEIEMQPGVEPRSQVQHVAHGWQLHAADGSGQLTLMPGAVALQTTRYGRWSVTLRPVLEALLTVTEEVLAPSVVSRIGLRYVDRFVEAEARTPADWTGRIHEALLGAAWHPVFGPHVLGAQQQVELKLGDAQGALLRHGPFVDAQEGGAVSYLVDIDVFDAETVRFDTPDLVYRAEVLNRTAASLFQATVTADYLRALQRAQAPVGDRN
jgi:uncharacterized protein (TIGR04255 family)